MKEVSVSHSPAPGRELDAASFRACLATILELTLGRLPFPGDGEDPATGFTLSRWLGGLGLGLVPVANPQSFSWPGPWIARIRPDDGNRRAVVMYGVPSGMVWDPSAAGPIESAWIEDGFMISATDIALAMPARPEPPIIAGSVEEIWVCTQAGAPAQALRRARGLPGRGLEGDRHLTGKGTFPSGVPGSALTLIEAEVCESFDPPLLPDEHRRNVVTRGIELNRLVGSEFTIGGLRCRGMRLCEPCTVVDGYASRPILRALVHRGGLRADILEEGEFTLGDEVMPSPGGRRSGTIPGSS